jgi:hypothetical protein
MVAKNGKSNLTTRPKSKTENVGAKEVKISPNYDAPFGSFYSNYASISHTRSELCVDFGIVSPPHKVDLEKQIAYAPVIVRVIIPPQLVDGLIGALKDQVEKQRAEEKDGVFSLSGGVREDRSKKS